MKMEVGEVFLSQSISIGWLWCGTLVDTHGVREVGLEQIVIFYC